MRSLSVFSIQKDSEKFENVWSKLKILKNIEGEIEFFPQNFRDHLEKTHIPSFQACSKTAKSVEFSGKFEKLAEIWPKNWPTLLVETGFHPIAEATTGDLTNFGDHLDPCRLLKSIRNLSETILRIEMHPPKGVLRS